MADQKFTTPGLGRLKGEDAQVLRQIVLALIQELERIRDRLDAGGL
jgi:hypothetical protein